ncbi:ATP-binding protein [Sphaerimonospora cavernae]|uniref:ATP-binding protein n=1 Tax=Sphaerimonospora cavernae TaxID=1740611 RepID=A0ABV6U4Y4_9ACTN
MPEYHCTDRSSPSLSRRRFIQSNPWLCLDVAMSGCISSNGRPTAVLRARFPVFMTPHERSRMLNETISDAPHARLLERAGFPATAEAVTQARRWLRTILDDHPCLDDAVLLLSETFTNSVRHTRSAAIGVVVIFDVDDCVQVEVVDDGAETSPCVRGHQDGDLPESGHGLRLLRALSSRWGFFEERPRCVVWFVIEPPAHTP